jgi:hypothetical protein
MPGVSAAGTAGVKPVYSDYVSLRKLAQAIFFSIFIPISSV